MPQLTLMAVSVSGALFNSHCHKMSVVFPFITAKNNLLNFENVSLDKQRLRQRLKQLKIDKYEAFS